jgi:hypothetical protein
MANNSTSNLVTRENIRDQLKVLTTIVEISHSTCSEADANENTKDFLGVLNSIATMYRDLGNSHAADGIQAQLRMTSKQVPAILPNMKSDAFDTTVDESTDFYHNPRELGYAGDGIGKFDCCFSLR